MTWKQMMASALQKRADRFEVKLCRLCRMGKVAHENLNHRFVGG